MAEIDTIRQRLKDLKARGKTPSTSKEAGKLAKRFRELKESGTTSISTPLGSTSLATTTPEAFEMSKSAILESGREAGKLQTLATSRELGRRGILPSSGLGERELAEAQRPVVASTQDRLSALGERFSNALESIRQFDVSAAISQAQQSLAERKFEFQKTEASKPKEKTAAELLIEDIISRRNVASTPTEPQPSFTPGGGEGSISPQGQWIFSGGLWIPNAGAAATTTGTTIEEDFLNFSA